MKSRLLSNMLVLVMSAAMVSSCEKMVLSESPETNGGNVVIRVSQFEQTPFDARTRTDVESCCTKLCFHIYDDSGQRIEYENQKQEDERFGTASFSLSEGHYYLIVVGHSGASNPSFSANEKVSVSGKNLGDTFWCCEELEVGEDEIRKDLILRRIVSLVRFLPTDELPAGADQMRISYSGSRGTFNGLTGYGSTTAKQLVNLEIADTDRQFEFYIIPRADEDAIDVTVTTHSTDDVGIHNLTEKTIDGIPLRRNYVTICKGNLFDNDSSSKSVFLTIAVDDDWDGEIPVNF